RAGTRSSAVTAVSSLVSEATGRRRRAPLRPRTTPVALSTTIQALMRTRGGRAVRPTGRTTAPRCRNRVRPSPLTHRRLGRSATGAPPARAACTTAPPSDGPAALAAGTAAGGTSRARAVTSQTVTRPTVTTVVRRRDDAFGGTSGESTLHYRS